MSETTLSPRTLTIVNRLGLHARAAAKLVTTAERFDAETTVERGGNVVSALSIMGLMMLGLEKARRLLSGHTADRPLKHWMLSKR